MWPKQRFVGSTSTHTALHCRLLLRCNKYALLLRDWFYLAFKATWRWGISPQLWRLRKHHCYRSTSVCLLLSADSHRKWSSPGVSQQRSPDCDEQHWASGESNGLVCQCLWGIRATTFWSSDGKWSFHHLSSQSVLECMFYLGQDTAGTMLMAQVLMPEFGGQMPLTPLENKHVQQQWSSSCRPLHPDAFLPPFEYPDQLNEKECFQQMLWDVCI